MPSVVALGCIDESARDRMNMDLVLDGVVDDRIEAAYAIIELGERGSRKEVEFPSAEEEDLDADETEQHHQVPRSPKCLCECRRGACYRSADPSPMRDTEKLLEDHLPKTVHVKGAVMPTMTFGNPVRKLTSKRRIEDDAISAGIKAKLARMLIERKFSQEETGKSSQDDGTCHLNGDADDSGEELNTEATRGGRFVRTSMPVLEPMNVRSHIQSAPNSKNSFENQQMKTEQPASEEEINKLSSSLRESLINEQVIVLQQGVDSPYKILHQGKFSSKNQLDEVSNFELNEASNDCRICSSEVSSKDVDASSSLNCTQDSSVLSEHFSASGKGVDVVIKSEMEETPARDGHCFLLRSSNQLTSASGTAGLLQYCMLPVMRTQPNPIDSNFCGIEPAVWSSVDALKGLEQFSLGKGYHSEPSLKGNLVVPETHQSPWNVKRYCHIYGSLNSISGHYGMSSSPVSEAEYPPSGLIESLSLQNLSSIQRDSPKIPNSNKQRLQSLKCDSVVNESKKSRNIEDKPALCKMKDVETKVTKPRRKLSAIVDALKMVKGGEFGSLRIIRNLYIRMNSRNVADLSACLLQNTRCSESRMKTEPQSLGFEEQKQELPLDLSRHCRRMSRHPTELKAEVESCSSYPQSFETFPLTDLSKKETRDLTDFHSKTAMEKHVMHSDVVPMKADGNVCSCSDSASSRLADLKNIRDSDEPLTHSLPHSVPNSHLPPKKRKPQDCDFWESKTLSSTESTLPRQGPSPHELKSSTYQISAESCPGQTLEPMSGRSISEADVITNDERALSAVTVTDEDGDLPLHIAVAQGSVDIVLKLLLAMSKVGLSVDSWNNNRQTALHLAVISNQTQMVELLLRASASANVCDRKGNTAIHLAVKYKTLFCLKKILENSRILLNLDARNYEGLTALHIGVQLSQADAVKALLSDGANPNAMDGTNGRTPLFNAVEANDFIIASTLIQHGSGPYIASYSGCTPLQIATGKSLREMISILEKSGRVWSRRVQESN